MTSLQYGFLTVQHVTSLQLTFFLTYYFCEGYNYVRHTKLCYDIEDAMHQFLMYPGIESILKRFI